MNKLKSLLIRPFVKSIGLMLYFILMYGMVDTLGWMIRGHAVYAFYTLTCVIPLAYISVLIYGLLPKIPRTIYLIMLSVFGLGWMFIDTVCNLVYQRPFNYDFAAFIKYSDPAESHDFIITYLSSDILIWYFVYILTIGLVLWCSDKIKFRPNNKAQIVWLGGLILCTIVLFYAPETGISRSPFGKSYLFSYIKDMPDLHDYLSNPNIIVDKARQPDNLVLILGESHSRNHNWLNGYRLQTNPETKQWLDKGLYVYSNVNAPGTSTLISISQYMSTYRPNNGKEWYESIFLPEVLNKGGYYTTWISNQGKRGLFDNAVTRYAELCDTAFFTSALSTSVNTAQYDEEILHYLGNQHIRKNNCTIIHLLGSHVNYHNRYPKEWGIFTPEDYSNLPENQRQTLADYDNSIAYSDHVVSEIIRSYQDKEALVVYFSDHAQDIFDTDPQYFGHARSNAESYQYGIKIPFYVYFSKKYQARFPEMVHKIAQEKDSLIQGETIFYRILDFAGIQLIDE